MSGFGRRRGHSFEWMRFGRTYMVVFVSGRKAPSAEVTGLFVTIVECSPQDHSAVCLA